jgi:predicted PhzF superfamily epimerase YddE/YHI9
VVLVYATEAEVQALSPDMFALTKLDHFGFIATAPGTKSDFVSRFFAPSKGVPEDPVTGSAHSTLIPYWAGKLGKTDLLARQISKRTGELYCKLRGDRVKISGYAAPYLRGTITVP